VVAFCSPDGVKFAMNEFTLLDVFTPNFGPIGMVPSVGREPQKV